MKIVIAPDSFKGCLSSEEVAAYVVEGLKDRLPDAEMITVPVADGGEGLVNALEKSLKGYFSEAAVSDPLGRPAKARYLISGRTAVIEVAEACGLKHVLHSSENGETIDERDPWNATSKGVGELILDAVGRGCTDFLIGLGGSAINDGGKGMVDFLKHKIQSFDGLHFTCACDVDATFVGDRGASRVFGQQKGASEEMVELLEKRLEDYSMVILEETGTDVRKMKGAGAAGGLGGAFAAYLGASLVPGIELVLDAIGFDSIIEGADLVITGEGRSDSQTAQGKTPYGVLGRAKAAGIPTVLLSGTIEDCPNLKALGFSQLIAVTPEGMDIEKAVQPHIARLNIIEACSRILI